jgi:UDP-N-acetylglucosamine:LPS N-acetylglucosamine transferase
MRVRNIATALASAAPDIRIGVHAAAAPEPELWDPELPVSHDDEVSWTERAASFDPDVVVYDTVLPPAGERIVSDRARYVFVMRDRLESRAAELFADPFLDRVEAFVVPHDADDVVHSLQAIPEHLVSRVHLVGTIGRRPHAAHRAGVRARYLDDGARRLLTSTVGGGGFRDQADRFFGAVLSTAHRVAAELPDVRHVVVLGPNYDNRAMASGLAVVPDVRVVRCEPAMVDLLAASDLVIAEGGYNTVTEVRLAEVPAVFVPSERGLDDQFGRVERLARDGAAAVWRPDGDVSALADTVVDLLADPGRRAAMTEGHRRRPVDLGNRRAADVIAAVARRRAPLGNGVEHEQVAR